MKRILTLSAALVLSACGLAQTSPHGPLRFRLSYGWSSSFRNANGNSARVEGPEIAVALPLGNFLGNSIDLEPSFFGGGRLRKGGDDDTDVYRLTLLARRTFGRGITVRSGIGYANSTNARGGNFKGVSAAVFDFGVEIPFSVKKLKRFSPFVDIHYIASDEKQLSGFFLGVGTKL